MRYGVAEMKALRLHKPYDLQLHDEVVPVPNSGEVLIQVKSVGVCASDLHYYREGRIGDQVITSPHILGHEFSGVVAGLGKGVTGIKVGARVAVEPAKPCGVCEICREGLINVCPKVEFFGTPPFQGALREYLTWPANLVMPVPDSMSFDEAAMIEPLAIGVYAVELSGLKGGETVVILGAGAIGLSCLQAAKIAGAGKTVVVEPVPERRELAKKLGADIALDSRMLNVQQVVTDLIGKYGADITFEAAGDFLAVKQTVCFARPVGTIVIVGIPDEDIYAFDASIARRKELTVKFCRRSRATAEKSIELVEEKKADVKSYATHVFPLERAAEAFELAYEKKDGVIRAVIRLSE